MQVLVPSPLQSYTDGRAQVEGSGRTVGEVLEGLDRAYPGIRFRMIDEQDRVREHIRFFVAGELARDLEHPIGEGDELQIICALSGG